MRRLRTVKAAVVSLTVLNLGFVLYANVIAVAASRDDDPYWYSYEFSIFQVVVGVSAILVLAFFESQRKHAEGYAEEVTRFIQAVLTSRDKSGMQLYDDGFFDERRIVRDLRSASELPFAPGRASATAYLIANLVLVLAGSWLVRI